MPTHRVPKKSVHDSPRGARKLGTCRVCGPESPLTLVLGKWVCAEGERLKQAEKGIRRANKDNPQQEAARIRAKIDRLASKAVRSVGCCIAEGWETRGKVYRCSSRLECAHVQSRGNSRIRHHPRNMVSLCNIHHRYFTQNPVDWQNFIEAKFPGLWDWLYELRRDPDVEPQSYWINYWQGELKKIEVPAERDEA